MNVTNGETTGRTNLELDRAGGEGDNARCGELNRHSGIDGGGRRGGEAKGRDSDIADAVQTGDGDGIVDGNVGEGDRADRGDIDVDIGRTDHAKQDRGAVDERTDQGSKVGRVGDGDDARQDGVNVHVTCKRRQKTGVRHTHRKHVDIV